MRRATFWFIFGTVLLDMLALGIIAPVFPKLVIQLERGNEASAAGLVGLFGTVWAATQFVAAALSLVGAVYGWFVLPESLPAEHRAPFAWRRANPVGSLGMLRAHGALLSLAFVAFLYRVAHDALPSLFVLYGDYRYGWTARTVRFALAGVGVVSMIVQGGLVGRVVRRLGESRALLRGLACGAVAFVMYGVAPTGTLFLLGIPVGGLFGLAYPSLQGLMTPARRPG